jgi:hypothetical protein
MLSVFALIPERRRTEANRSISFIASWIALLMGVFDARIEQRHDRNRLLGRALEVIETGPRFRHSGRSISSGNRIDILLERGENGLGNVLPGELKIIRKQSRARRL